MDKKFKSFFEKRLKIFNIQFPLSGRNPLDDSLPWDYEPGAAASGGTSIEEVDAMDKFMNIFEGNGVPLDAITKGRSLGDVLSKYMEMWEGAKKALGFHGEDPEAEFAALMQATVYRLYLLGVEDGMREGQA